MTSTSTKQTQTPITKLKDKRLSNFINETSYIPQTKTTPAFSKTLDYNRNDVDMHKASNKFNDEPIVFVGTNVNELKLSEEGLKEIIDSFHAFREISENAEMAAIDETGEACHEEFLEEEAEIVHEPIVATPSSKLKKSKSRFKERFHSSAEMEELSKQTSLGITLRAYLDCCVQNGMLNRGYLTIMNYRSRYKRLSSGIKITDVNLYNLLIQGFAEKMNLQKVKELMNFLKEDEIKPNNQTFASFFECLGRLSTNPDEMEKYHITSRDDLVKLINANIEEASQHQFTLNSIVDKSIFLKDQREVVLDAIRLAVPNFQPIYTPPDILYSNKIMTHLNKNVKPIEFNPLEHLGEKVAGSEIMNSKKGFSLVDLEVLAKEQLETELNGFISIKSIQSFQPPTPFVLHCRSKIEELLKSWHETIVMSFNRDFNTLRHQEQSRGRGTLNLLPYLRALEVEEYASVVLREIRSLAEGSETFSPTVTQLYRTLGNKVQLRYQIEHKKRNGILQKSGEIYGNFCDILAAGTSSDNPRQCWQRLVFQKTSDGPSMNFHQRSWPINAQISVGRFLYNIIMRDLRIDVNILKAQKHKFENQTPAFYTLFRNHGKLVKEEVKPHPVLIKLYRGSQQESLTFEVNVVPMICPPQPWSSSRNGGYLLAKSDLIRLHHTAHQQLDMIDEKPPNHLYPALDSLNQLSSIAWTVHTDVLDVIIKVFKAGGNEKLDVPQSPSSLTAPPVPENESSLSQKQKFQAYQKQMDFRRKQAEAYSLWCDALYRLSLANHYRDRVFWLPHNMDFRGRVYPIPPHLNHLGSDLARCLLVFHKKKKLGVNGFMWLKLHCINLTGFKKRESVSKRLLFAEEIMDEILDSADHPLDGRKWWTTSDEPWQTLTCCMEIAKVLRSGDPENYESSLPIHQDGSCNGLQHYAALGRDSAGAFSVNLSPASVPQDVYNGIAQLVEQTRKKDEENGLEVARVLRNYVRRKVVKQTVMTTVYGVTRYGARLQIAKQLKNIEEFPKQWIWPASSYLTSKTFDSLREMFSSAKEIQDWLTECARLISSVCNQNVEWITPLDLPVVQPYNRKSSTRNVFNKSVKLDATFSIDTYTKPDSTKQKNAFPPNFVHSLDSSHMMLTSLNSEKAGITFMSVHDCFWTHACTVPEMNKICREQFVALHNEPILENLSKHLIDKYSFEKK